jgi:hypothetical protein
LIQKVGEVAWDANGRDTWIDMEGSLRSGDYAAVEGWMIVDGVKVLPEHEMALESWMRTHVAPKGFRASI